jgi:hypothetical protein
MSISTASARLLGFAGYSAERVYEEVRGFSGRGLLEY